MSKIDHQREGQGVDVPLPRVDFNAVPFGPTEWTRLKTMCDLSRAVELTDCDSRSSDPMMDVRFDPWFILSCLQLVPATGLAAYEAELRPHSRAAECMIPVRSMLMDRYVVKIMDGSQGTPVDPQKIASVADLENPYATALDWTKLAHLAMQRFYRQITDFFVFYDQPKAVRWALQRFSSAQVDQQTHTLRISRDDVALAAIQNPRQPNLPEIRANRLSLGWKVELI